MPIALLCYVCMYVCPLYVCSIDENTDTPVAIRNLDCNGATSLEACQFEVLSAPDPECTHSEDAALECSKYLLLILFNST